MTTTNLKIKKAHDLVTARYSFSLIEIRLFTLIVSMIKDQDEDFEAYKIPIKQVIDTFWITNKNIYAEISDLTTSMLKKIITIPIEEDGKKKELKTSIVSSFKYNVDGRGVLEATFNPMLKPYLLSLKNKFLLYDIKNILKINSAHSIRIYEFLKSYEGIGKRAVGVEELKDMLCVSDKYRKYANFKSRILLKAQTELKKHTDIRFEFDELSIGRRVENIIFYIHTNKRKTVIEASETENPEPDLPKRQLDILALWISKATLQSQVLNLYKSEFIQETLNRCHKYFKHTAVQHKSGFFLKALKEGFFSDQINTETSKKEKQQQTAHNHQEQKLAEELATQQREERLQQLREQYQTPELVEEVLASHEGNRFMYPIMKETRDQGKIHKVLQAFVDKRLEEEYGEIYN